MPDRSVKRYKTIIIGGGASGLLLSHLLPSSLLIEKNSQCGLKLLITGNGKCNITHSGDTGEFITHYYEKKKFVSSFIYSFPPEKIREFFSSISVETYIRDDGKVFPSSERSVDIRDALLKGCGKILYDTTVLSTKKEDDTFIVEATSGTFLSDILVVSTGGKSYPETGSTGDGYSFASSFGHRVITPAPALAPIRLSIDTSPLEGVSVSSVTIKTGKEKQDGAVVFTKRGISGPAAENISRSIEKDGEIEITFFDNLTAEEIKSLNGKMNALNAIREITSLPHSLLLFLFPSLKETNVASLRKEELLNIIKTLKAWRVKALKSSFKGAMVTKGGVDTNEIKPGSGESKLVGNLYFAGEVIDTDGECGGYNLTFALASAYSAAKDIRKKI